MFRYVFIWAVSNCELRFLVPRSQIPFGNAVWKFNFQYAKSPRFHALRGNAFQTRQRHNYNASALQTAFPRGTWERENKQIKQVWFGKYVQYWSGESIQRTQREWSLHFANHMQGYLLRPDFFEKVNGMLEDNQPFTARNRGDKACLVSTTRVTTVPRLNDGEQLQTWALAHDLPAAPVGVSTEQYRHLLCQPVEISKKTRNLKTK